MKVLIDARMYGVEYAGIGRYVMNLITQLQEIDKINSYILLFRKSQAEKLEINNCKFEIRTVDIPHYSLMEQIKLPGIIVKEKPDLVHFPHFNVPIFYQGKYVVTIHDLIKHSSRGAETTTRQPWLYWCKYLGYKLVFSQAVKRAVKILVPSNWTKKELVKTYKIPDDKVVVTYEGVDNKFQISDKILDKYKIQKPFVIYTGSLYPHKNVERLIQAIKLINQPSINLVISCARNVFYERFEKRVKAMGAEKFVNLVVFVPDEELTILYREAEAFVFPTLSEGFGLPGLEAMACGCPVVCSDIPVLREIYGEAAIYFDPYDVQEIAKKIKEVCSNDLYHDSRKELILKGYKKVQKYSWKKMAKDTLDVYNEI